MLKRKIEFTMEEWLNHSQSKALCIFGARQIGKTTSAYEFGRKHFKQVIKIDFIETPAAKAIFESEGADSILEQIELFSRTPIIPGQTLILLDEIQECPKARTAIKYLVQDNRCKYIETGSLLGVKLSQIPSVPVGFEEAVNMYPLDFEEFLWALNVPVQTIENLRICFEKRKPVPEFIHNEMKKIFLHYLIIGGMPEAVTKFCETNSAAACFPIQNSIWQLYGQDITKYAERSEISRILDIFDSVPSQLNSQDLRFVLAKIDGRVKPRFSEYEGALTWLTQAGIVLPCFNTSEPQFPLKLNEKRRLFRLYCLDCGLLCSRFPGIQTKLLSQDPTLNWGAFLENASAQILCANGFSLYYFNQKNMGELDFVIEEGDQISLLEMKSGHNYRKHSAINHALDKKNWLFKNAYVFCEGNIETDGQICYLPWYMLTFLKKPEIAEKTESFNYEGLSFSIND